MSRCHTVIIEFTARLSPGVTRDMIRRATTEANPAYGVTRDTVTGGLPGLM